MVNIHCDTILRDFSSAFLGKKSKKVFLWSSELNNLAIILSRNLEYKLPVEMDKILEMNRNGISALLH